MLAISLLPGCVTHNAPSGPVVRPRGLLSPARNQATVPVVVIRPTTEKNEDAVNHNAFAWTVMLMGCGAPVGKGVGWKPGIGNSVMVPVVVIRPICLLPNSVNHSAPSGPAVMPRGELLRLGMANSVTLPPVVIRPIWLRLDSVNHSAPSGPVVMPRGPLLALGMGNSVMTPPVVIRPIWSLPNSVNQSAPSGPT